MKRLVLALALFAGACASGAPYAPAARPGASGFSDVRIENDRYRVSFRGAQSPEAASDFVLLRAADLTLMNGYDWFVVDSRTVNGRPYSSGPRLSVGLGGATFGGHSGVGVGIGTGIPLGGGGSITDATLEIRMGRGPKPTNVDAYDARSVQGSIGPRVRGH